jgi:hypothetical protein
MRSGKFHRRKSIVPRWTIRYQRIPSTGSPAFGNPVFLKNDMGDFIVAKMLAERESGLTCADDHRICFFDWHLCLPNETLWGKRYERSPELRKASPADFTLKLRPSR